MNNQEALKEFTENSYKYMNKVDIKLSRATYEYIKELLQKQEYIENEESKGYGAYTVVSYEGENQDYLKKVSK